MGKGGERGTDARIWRSEVTKLAHQYHVLYGEALVLISVQLRVCQSCSHHVIPQNNVPHMQKVPKVCSSRQDAVILSKI